MSSQVQFLPLAADAVDFPPPRVPMLAPLSFRHWSGGRRVQEGSVFLENGFYFPQGRYAFVHALRAAGVGPDGAVLMPAYHCRSLIEPALYLKGWVAFYTVDDGLRPNTAALDDLISSSRLSFKALVLPHYFGFPQILDELLALCQAHKVALIEDCAHAFYGSVNGRPLGSFGRFAVASPRKFFPVEDGGILVANSGDDFNAPVLKAQPVISEAKAAVRSMLALARSLREGGKHLSSVRFSGDWFSGLQRERQPESRLDSSLQCLDATQVNKAGLFVSRLIIRTAGHDRIIRLRKRHFGDWLEAVKDLTGCRPLFAHVPETVVPYVFPLIIENDPEAVFFGLKSAGVPLWRWEDMALTSCPVSRRYRLSLVQLPCHQALSDKQMDWLTRTVIRVVTAVNNRSG